MQSIACIENIVINKGFNVLTDAQLLALIIGKGIKGKTALDIAKDTLITFGGFKGFNNRPLEHFLKIKGLGDATIIKIGVMFEFATRIAKNAGTQEF